MEEIQAFLVQIKAATIGYLTKHLSETIQVEIKEGRQKVSFDKVILPGFDKEAILLVMLNTAQSVGLVVFRILN